MDGADFDALVADIKANGVLEAIVVQDGLVVDGWNRYRATIKLGIECPATSFAAATGGQIEVEDYIISHNIHRRHLSAAQRAAITVQANEAKLARQGGDRKSKDHGGPLISDDLAKKANTSKRTVKAVREVKKHAPDLFEKLRTGKTTVRKAKAEIKQRREKAKPDPERAKREAYAKLMKTLGRVSNAVDAINEDELTPRAYAKLFNTWDSPSRKKCIADFERALRWLTDAVERMKP
jgi:ParB-like chromosome segregation protein Spo0J